VENEQNSQILKLLDRARGGDDDARNELFEKCRSYVHLVARAHVESWIRTKVDASDLVQQTMLEAHRGFENFRGQSEGEWLAWLKRILSHNAVDYIRHYKGTQKRQANLEVPMWKSGGNQSDEFFFEPGDPGESPSQIILRKEREIELADAIAQLDDDYQEIIMLRNLQRLSFNEVADRMNRSRPAVQMLWMRALKKLESILNRPD